MSLKSASRVAWSGPVWPQICRSQSTKSPNCSKEMSTSSESWKVKELQFRAGGLVPGHMYEFRVTAENAAGISAPSISSPFYKATDTLYVPGAPCNPRVLDTTKSSITVAWNKPVYDGGSEVTGYVVETCIPCEKEEDEEWTIRTPKEGLKATNFTILNLKENQEYKIQISALNSEGMGEAAAVPENPKAEDRLLPPEMDVDAELRKVVSLRACCSLRLFVPIRGRPTPTAKWTKEDGETVERATIDTTTSYTSLVIENVNRFDSGKYNLTVENSSGSKTVTVQKPQPPGKIILKDVTKSSVTLTWEKPAHDGGSRVGCYVVEVQPKGVEKWTQALIVKETEATISNLNAGEEYMFRVAARNEKGTSDPRQIGVPVIVKDLVIAPDVKMLFNTFSVLAGEDLTIDIPFVARPKAAVSWVKDGVPLKRTTRVNFSATETMTAAASHGRLHFRTAAQRSLTTLWRDVRPAALCGQ
uniref:Titin n=1 Tax=Periophthalmus magnuspinnatus TaxID=409849 RepID=A0A3B4ACT1_9GOBI